FCCCCSILHSLQDSIFSVSPPFCFLLLQLRFLYFYKLERSTTSTLFPYTTLFRSRRARRRARPHKARNHLQYRTFCPLYSRSVLDRKSTRLNSSHVSISYAVFCLKKRINFFRLPNFLLAPSSSQVTLFR